MVCSGEARVEFMRTHISRRAIRDNSEDEMEAFVRWVGRRPHHTEAMIHVVYALAEGEADWESESSGEEPSDNEDD